MRLKCPNKKCGYCWNYYGDSEHLATCPTCHTRMSIERARKRAKGKSLSLPPREQKKRVLKRLEREEGGNDDEEN